MKSEAKQSRIKRYWRKCVRCDHRFAKEKSLCPSCYYWNTPTEIAAEETILLSQVTGETITRISTGPWDNLFGFSPNGNSGIVTSSVVLIGGSPGAGKSTFALQFADSIAEARKREVLYIAAEESAKQIRDRADRLQVRNASLLRLVPMGGSEDLTKIFERFKPSAIIIDSLPALVPDKDVAAAFCSGLKEWAVKLEAPIVVIDQVNKELDFAGTMSLQHAVDVLIALFPDEAGIRTMYTIKNRFGPTPVSCMLNMTTEGLILGLEENEEKD